MNFSQTIRHLWIFISQKHMGEYEEKYEKNKKILNLTECSCSTDMTNK